MPIVPEDEIALKAFGSKAGANILIASFPNKVLFKSEDEDSLVRLFLDPESAEKIAELLIASAKEARAAMSKKAND